MKNLSIEEIWHAAKWERKLQGSGLPENIKYVWHSYSVPSDSPRAVLTRLARGVIKEETQKVCRCIFLGSDSLGRVLVVTEEPWEPE
jgi:hypothetical protein